MWNLCLDNQPCVLATESKALSAVATNVTTICFVFLNLIQKTNSKIVVVLFPSVGSVFYWISKLSLKYVLFGSLSPFGWRYVGFFIAQSRRIVETGAKHSFTPVSPCFGESAWTKRRTVAFCSALPTPSAAASGYRRSWIGAKPARNQRKKDTDWCPFFVGCGGGIWTSRPPGYEGSILKYSFLNLPDSMQSGTCFLCHSQFDWILLV